MIHCNQPYGDPLRSTTPLSIAINNTVIHCEQLYRDTLYTAINYTMIHCDQLYRATLRSSIKWSIANNYTVIHCDKLHRDPLRSAILWSLATNCTVIHCDQLHCDYLRPTITFVKFLLVNQYIFVRFPPLRGRSPALPLNLYKLREEELSNTEQKSMRNI